MKKFLFACLFLPFFGFSQNTDSNQMHLDSIAHEDHVVEGVPFYLGTDTLYVFYGGMGPFSAEDRRLKFEKNFRKIGLQRSFDFELLRFNINEFGGQIAYDNTALITVTPEDAHHHGKSVFNLVQVTRERIAVALKEQSESWAWGEILLPFISVIGVILFGVLWWRWVSRVFRFLRDKTAADGGRIFQKTKFKNYNFIDQKRGLVILHWLTKLGRILLLGLGYYALLLIVFSFFPATEGMASKLFEYVVQPFLSLFQGLVAYLPNLIKMVVIIFIAKSIVRFLAYLSEEIEHGSIDISGFYKDWANPTFNIFRFLVYAFTFIVIYPYLPGSESPIFAGVTVFIGLLLALGSIPSAQNFIAGIVMTYMRAFTIGDRIKMGDHSGVVVEKNILSLRIRTSKNEDITVPNSQVLSNKTINYSSNTDKNGVILHTSVTVNYDIPWQRVHALLEEAAENTEMILDEPRPFVLERELAKDGVRYQVNAFTKNATQLSAAYAQLHQNILTVFKGEGIPLGY
ncbi:MAG: small-conductance mechanosensitive channel [Luteibaculaceae bacterium]|jgi:small-conductance mechanosensitive channel